MQMNGLHLSEHWNEYPSVRTSYHTSDVSCMQLHTSHIQDGVEHSYGDFQSCSLWVQHSWHHQPYTKSKWWDGQCGGHYLPKLIPTIPCATTRNSANARLPSRGNCKTNTQSYKLYSYCTTTTIYHTNNLAYCTVLRWTVEPQSLYYTLYIVMSKPWKFWKLFSHKLHSKSGTIVACPVDRLGGKFIGFIVLNQ